ncbi:hypothetical protein [Pseudaestuariivita sp.]|uniref:hypothetical protein n=1 Tax=Pseudaestuariivita sp. TaxID=2211669 RepID=UPI00405A2DF7
MHAAGMHSPRLRRVLKVLKDGKPHSTREIVRKAGVCAVNAVVAELRANGAEIACWQQLVDDRRVWFYRMTKEPTRG